MPVWAPDTQQTERTKTVVLSCNIGQAAGTYTAGTVSGGDILIVSISPFMSVAGVGLTSVVVQTNNTTADVLLASTLLAALTVGKNLTPYTTPSVLPSGKLIQYTVVGIGSAGTLQLAVRYQALTSGASLA